MSVSRSEAVCAQVNESEPRNSRVIRDVSSGDVGQRQPVPWGQGKRSRFVEIPSGFDQPQVGSIGGGDAHPECPEIRPPRNTGGQGGALVDHQQVAGPQKFGEFGESVVGVAARTTDEQPDGVAMAPAVLRGLDGRPGRRKMELE